MKKNLTRYFYYSIFFMQFSCFLLSELINSKISWILANQIKFLLHYWFKIVKKGSWISHSQFNYRLSFVYELIAISTIISRLSLTLLLYDKHKKHCSCIKNKNFSFQFHYFCFILFLFFHYFYFYFF